MTAHPTRDVLRDWSGEDLRRLAVGLLADSLVHASQGKRGVARVFLTDLTPRWRSWRRCWLGILDVDVDRAEAALARLLALPETERRARVAALTRLFVTGPGWEAWDREQAFPGTLETSDRREA